LKNDKSMIIAEIGVNHNGDETLLKNLIKSAAKCGVDACKFQTFNAAKLASASTPKVEYQLSTSDPRESHVEMLTKLQMSHEMHLLALETCQRYNVEFISTPYDPEAVEYLASLGVDKIKTASADIVDHRIHKKISELNLKPFVAVGMATEHEISEAVEIYKASKYKPTILHCVSSYPSSDEALNLRCIPYLRDKYSLNIGLSDHSIGSQAAVLSVALGASVIEKHFTLDKRLDGPDHQASCTPEEMNRLVAAIRRAEVMLGNDFKQIQKEELSMKRVSRKSAHTLTALKTGETLTEDNITMMRPGNGISGKDFYGLLGKKVRRSLDKHEMLNLDDVE